MIPDRSRGFGALDALLYDRVVGPCMDSLYDAALDAAGTADLDALTSRAGGADVSRGAPAHVLDVGCGPGHGLARLVARRPDARVVGIDPSMAMARLARRRAARRAGSAAPRVRVVRASAGALPFRAGAFDLVLSNAALKYWPDRIAGLDEIHRVLGPGGLALVTEVDRAADDALVLGFLRGFPLGRIDAGARWHLRRFHAEAGARSLTLAEAHDLVARSAFASGEVAPVPGLPFFRLVLRRAS